MTVKTSTDRSASGASHPARTADGGPSVALRSPTAIRRLRTRAPRQRGWRHGASLSRIAPLPAARTTPPPSSPSITKPASSAIAAFAAATRFATTWCWRAAARATRPASPSITTCRWASRPASPAASAWFPVPPARLPTSVSSEPQLGEGDVLDPAELLHAADLPERFRNIPELNRRQS